MSDISELRNLYVGNPISMNGLIPLTIDLMSKMEKISKEGLEKKMEVLKLVNLIITNSPNLTPQFKMIMKDRVATMLPHVVDVVIMLAKNKHILKQFAKTNCSGCIPF